ncbi:type II toxin-antitoxin system antitoxin SocA domain-containing protein [Paracidovorax wautersii]|uniref:Phage-associated protein n=1 Tax=Paracidovorax wautersii TaxID=1177982 RepID=A0ABU1IH71_9BURK|nr:type II toxin-antitoxin system antitoxin SocA domain-containing protein [Paracidovorax wautersii]MDR6216167.1 putative phage-associated protein [Paracidovorax wautersii]
MADVSNVARYFLSLAEDEAGDDVSNLKLQKLLYYAQGFHLALFDRPLFENEIRAWTHGPVVAEVYRDYKQHGGNPIPRAQCDLDALTNAEQELLAEVYQVYGQYSAWKLRNMTHEEAPWVTAYGQAPDSVISHGAMRDFFRTLVH